MDVPAPDLAPRHETIYVTSQHVHRHANRRQSWEVVSPDLTTNDKSKQTISGASRPDNIGVEYCCVIYAFDESPAQEGVLWAGTNDGSMHVSRTTVANWTNVTATFPISRRTGWCGASTRSKWDPAKAYITIEHHQVGDFEPRAYKTEDFGESWTQITNGVDNFPVDYTRYLLEDAVAQDSCTSGTESQALRELGRRRQLAAAHDQPAADPVSTGSSSRSTSTTWSWGRTGGDIGSWTTSDRCNS